MSTSINGYRSNTVGWQRLVSRAVAEGFISIPSEGQELPHDPSRPYDLDDVVVVNDEFFMPNDIIPSNTEFQIGTTGPTWRKISYSARLIVNPFSNLKDYKKFELVINDDVLYYAKHDLEPGQWDPENFKRFWSGTYSFLKEAHGNVKGQLITATGIKAIASDSDTLSVGMVASLTDDSFEVITTGALTLMPTEWDAVIEDGGPLIPGDFYFLSGSEEGKMTPTQPEAPDYDNPVGFALDETTFIVLPYRPAINEEAQLIDATNIEDGDILTWDAEDGKFKKIPHLSNSVAADGISITRGESGSNYNTVGDMSRVTGVTVDLNPTSSNIVTDGIVLRSVNRVNIGPHTHFSVVIGVDLDDDIVINVASAQVIACPSLSCGGDFGPPVVVGNKIIFNRFRDNGQGTVVTCNFIVQW